MSFYGKKYKKVDINSDIIALIISLNLGEKSIELLKNRDTYFSIVDNGDGSYSYEQLVKDTVVSTQKFTPGKEEDYVSPDGLKAKATIEIDGNTVTTTIKDDTGRVLHMKRIFDGDKATMELTIEGDSRVGTVAYEAS